MKKATSNGLQSAREYVLAFCLLDDILMRVFFHQHKESVQFVLRIIMDNPSLIVKHVSTQEDMPNLVGRSVRLDIYAEDSEGKKYNIEVQNAKEGASLKRARLNASIMDTIGSNPGDKYDVLSENYVIFITESDPFGYGLPIYHIDKFIRENSVVVDDGAHIIYVNAQIKDETPLGRLMHDFSCADPKDMHYELLANRMHYIKTDEQEVGKMCEATEKKLKERDAIVAAETKAKTNLNAAAKMVLTGLVTVEQVSKTLGVPVEDIEEALNAEPSVAAN